MSWCTWRRLSAEMTPNGYTEVHRTPGGHELRRTYSCWRLFTNRGDEVATTEVEGHGIAEPPLAWAQRELARHFGAKR